ncbi:hypothetical protein ABQE69_09150 [Mycolicibacillus trivialis]
MTDQQRRPQLTAGELHELRQLETQFNPTIRCQCDHKGGCEGGATVIAEIHRLHRCNDTDTNADGNDIRLLCLPCTQGLIAHVNGSIGRLLATMTPAHIPACGSCGAPITRYTDVVRKIRHHAGGVR